ncbi:hypothetical protein HK098_001253 [Nowakowskiella sp. JEL0407]|nr:hypothetical protein HK098_001253 [Nowakowskiella sp. JEL0407]
MNKVTIDTKSATPPKLYTFSTGSNDTVQCLSTQSLAELAKGLAEIAGVNLTAHSWFFFRAKKDRKEFEKIEDFKYYDENRELKVNFISLEEQKIPLGGQIEFKYELNAGVQMLVSLAKVELASSQQIQQDYPIVNGETLARQKRLADAPKKIAHGSMLFDDVFPDLAKICQIGDFSIGNGIEATGSNFATCSNEGTIRCKVSGNDERPKVDEVMKRFNKQLARGDAGINDSFDDYASETEEEPVEKKNGKENLSNEVEEDTEATESDKADADHKEPEDETIPDVNSTTDETSKKVDESSSSTNADGESKNVSKSNDTQQPTKDITTKASGSTPAKFSFSETFPLISEFVSSERLCKWITIRNNRLSAHTGRCKKGSWPPHGNKRLFVSKKYGKVHYALYEFEEYLNSSMSSSKRKKMRLSK